MINEERGKLIMTMADDRTQAEAAQHAAFWEGLFTQAEGMLRIGSYRIAAVDGNWVVMEDGVGYPNADPCPSQQAAVDYCVVRSIYHRSRDNYAMAMWSVEDVHSYRSGHELPEWTEDKAIAFLDDAEGSIQDCMIEAGWEALSTRMDMAEEDEDIDQEA